MLRCELGASRSSGTAADAERTELSRDPLESLIMPIGNELVLLAGSGLAAAAHCQWAVPRSLPPLPAPSPSLAAAAFVNSD